MKVLIASLQVSHSGSKGHLHPALEVALECRRRGHTPVLMPLPSPFGAEDRAQLLSCGIDFVDPPQLPLSVIKAPEVLAELAANPDRTWEAYHSFLVEPLQYQFGGIHDMIVKVAPDIVLYDLLAYAAPLAARGLGIPDVGFCAGLKLIAPDKHLAAYQVYRERLDGSLQSFLKSIEARARFHHLELLSEYGQLVFADPCLIQDRRHFPAKTLLMGALPISESRGDCIHGGAVQPPDRNYAVLSFGSVLDPADFPGVLKPILRVTEAMGLALLIGSRKLSRAPECLPSHAKAYSYLPIPSLLAQAKVFFHHGGASTFSEALTRGARQILIPLTTDQPIQAHYLEAAGVGFQISPAHVNEQALRQRVERLLDLNDSIQSRISEMAKAYRLASGAGNTVRYLEKVALLRRAV